MNTLNTHQAYRVERAERPASNPWLVIANFDGDRIVTSHALRSLAARHCEHLNDRVTLDLTGKAVVL